MNPLNRLRRFRHASISKIFRRRRDSRDCALVRVRDNGSGLKPDTRLGLGLTGMRERIAALGGTLTVGSGDGGVVVEALVPTGQRV